MSIEYNVIIPARLASSRLPNKPLLDIAGKPMIQHVCERAIESGAVEVLVATDSGEIVDVVQGFGGCAVMTAVTHQSGTDRLAEVVANKEWDDDAIVVNLQGDEPMMEPGLIEMVARNLATHEQAGMATLATPIVQREDVFSPDIVKVVLNASGFAQYFSRAPIPWVRGDYGRDGETEMPVEVPVLRHLGIYAYRVGVLKRLTSLPVAPIERAESLEQLRALWHGIQIHVGVIEEAPGHGVDTTEDLGRVRAILEKRNDSD